MTDEQRADAQHYRAIAENIRQLARQSHIPLIREEMFDLADQLDRMADIIDNAGSGPASRGASGHC